MSKKMVILFSVLLLPVIGIWFAAILRIQNSISEFSSPSASGLPVDFKIGIKDSISRLPIHNIEGVLMRGLRDNEAWIKGETGSPSSMKLSLFKCGFQRVYSTDQRPTESDFAKNGYFFDAISAERDWSGTDVFHKTINDDNLWIYVSENNSTVFLRLRP